MELIQLEKLEIALNNDKTAYQSGDTISGTVNIKFSKSGNYIKEIDLSIVTILLRSMTEVKWSENPGSVHYRGGFIYCDCYQDLDIAYDIPDQISKTTSNGGEHRVPFSFDLPENIPSSIDAQYGFISYWIEVIINNDEWSAEGYRERKDFTVESPFREKINLSVGGGAEKELGLLNVGSGKVRIDASLLKKAHLPGEIIEVHCLVTNTSTVAVTPRASFYQTQIFMSKGRHWTREHSIEPIVGQQVNAGETRDQIILVQIPANMPLSMKTRLISIKYFIHVTLDIPHAIDLHVNLPVILTNRYALG